MTEKEFLTTFVDAVDNLEPGDVGIETILNQIPAWDSLALLNLLAAIDAEYGIQLSGQELADCAAVGDIFRKAEAKSTAEGGE